MRTRIRKLLRSSTIIKESSGSSEAIIERAKRLYAIAKKRYQRYGSMKHPTPPYPDKEEWESVGRKAINPRWASVEWSKIEMDADKLKAEFPRIYDWLLYFMTSRGFDGVNQILPLRYWNEEFWAQATLCPTFWFVDRESAGYLKKNGVLEYAPDIFFWILVLTPDNMGRDRYIMWFGDRATDDMKWYFIRKDPKGFYHIGNPTQEMKDYAFEQDPHAFQTHELINNIVKKLDAEKEQEDAFMKKMKTYYPKVAEIDPEEVSEEDRPIFDRLLARYQEEKDRWGKK